MNVDGAGVRRVLGAGLRVRAGVFVGACDCREVMVGKFERDLEGGIAEEDVKRRLGSVGISMIV